MARRSRGRQKIEMVKMTNESNLQVTFSKRRFGLFKKASELVTLCGVEVGLIVFSPGNKVFTFGHPNVETVIEKYKEGHFYQSVGHYQNNSDRVAEASHLISAGDLHGELSNRENLLLGEKKVGEIIGQRLEKCELYNRWWQPSVEELSLAELKEFKAALEGLKQDLDERLKTCVVQKDASNNPFTLDSRLLGRNFSPSSGFNGTLPFVVGHGEGSFTSMLNQTLRESEAGSSSMSLGFDLGFGSQFG